MATGLPRITVALDAIKSFTRDDLTGRIAELESAVKGCDGEGCRAKEVEAGVTADLLAAAYDVKRAAGQINVLIHAVAVLLLVPKIVESGERIEYVSLGAGNTGRPFDLETDRRIAEFKFIHWKGGAETIRQNALFKDFYQLAENPSQKRKELFVLGTTHPLKFLLGGRALDNVLSKNAALAQGFRDRYGRRFETVGQYYQFRRHAVEVRDAAPLLPELVKVVAVEEAAEEKAATL